MWVKLLRELRSEHTTYPVGTVFWARRVGVISSRMEYYQSHSTIIIEDRERHFTMVLPDVAENDLYEECGEPSEIGAQRPMKINSVHLCIEYRHPKEGSLESTVTTDDEQYVREFFEEFLVALRSDPRAKLLLNEHQH